MNRDYKIEKINAYKKLIETKRLPRAPEPDADGKAQPSVEAEIAAEFTTWAEGQLSRLLGEPTKGDPQTPLTEEETVFLKAWVQKLQRKVESREQESAPAPAQPAQKNPSIQTVPRQSRTAVTEDIDPAQPIGHRLRKPKSGQDLADALDDMDRNGPVF